MITAEQSLDQLSRQLTAGQALDQRVFLAFGQCRVECRTNEPRLAQRLREYFSDFLAQPGPVHITVDALEGSTLPAGYLPWTIKPPEPGKTRVKEEYVDLAGGRVVRKRLTGLMLLFGGPLNLAVGPCLANDNQVINFVNNRYIQWMLERGWLLCHAAGVAHQGAGLALAGQAGAGKSTLALHLMSLGLNLVSNDRLLIRRLDGAPSMEGVAKLPRINPGTALNNPDLAGVIPDGDRQRFSDLPKDELWQLEHKYDVFLDQSFGPGRFELSAPFDALALLTWRHDGGPYAMEEVDLAARPDLLEAFIKSPGLFYLPEDGLEGDDPSLGQVFSPEDFLAVMQGVRIFEFSGGVDFAAAALRLKEFLTTAGGGSGRA